MRTRNTARWIPVGALVLSMAGLGLALSGCDRETSSSKEKSTKIVDTPEGKKKVTETTETTTTKEKKDNP